MADEFTPIPVQNWDATPKCPKCEADRDEIDIKWKSGIQVGQDKVNGEVYDLPLGFEHLLCKCLECTYEWITQTADADERAQAAKEAAEEREKEEEKEEDDAPKSTVARGHASRVVREE